MLVAMAGLPGTGKTTLAARLAADLGGVVLNKDEVRAVLFPPPVLNYTAEQDDLTMAAIYSAATSIRRTFPRQAVFIDGRTFLKSHQQRDLLALAERLNEPVSVIECICADGVAKSRLEHDLALGTHPARNRTFELYLAGKARAEPLIFPHLTLDTGTLTLEECVRLSHEYLLK